MSTSTAIKVPKLGLTVTEVLFVEWLAANGTHVNAGDTICSVESDKAVMEIVAPAAGVLRHSAVPENVYKVGDDIGEILSA